MLLIWIVVFGVCCYSFGHQLGYKRGYDDQDEGDIY